MTFRRFTLMSPDSDAGAAGGIPSDPPAPETASLADAMHFDDDDQPQDDGEPQDQDGEPQDDASADAADDGQPPADDGTDPPSADPTPPPPKAPPPKPVDPVLELANTLKARDELQQRRYDEFLQRQEADRAAAAETRAREQAAAAAQQRRADFEAQLKAARPRQPPPDAPFEQYVQWQNDLADYTQAAAEARARFAMQELSGDAVSRQEERIRAMEARAREQEAQAEARAAELAVDRDLAQLRSMPEMGWLKNPVAEKEFFTYWASLQTGGAPVSGIDAARRFMAMFSAVVPHVRKQTQKTAPPRGTPPQNSARPQPSRGPNTGAQPPRGGTRAADPAPKHWTSTAIKW